MRILRTLLWFFCILALLAIGAVVALYFLVTPDSVQNRLQGTLNQAGLTIRTNELPAVKVLPTISISLPSAQLFDAQNKLIAQYRSAQLTVSPWWLALGQIHVNKFLLDGFSLQKIDCPSPSKWLADNITTRTALIDGLTIESIELNDSDIHLKYKDRVINLQNLRALIGSPAPQMHAPVALSTQFQLLPDNLLLDIQAGFSLDLNMASSQMSLENLSIQADGTHEGRSFNASMSSPLTQVTIENLYAKTAQLQLMNAPTFGDLSLSVAELNVNTESVQAPDVYIQYNKGNSSEVIKLDLRSPVLLDRLQTTINADHIQGALVLPEQTESIPISGSVQIDWNSQKIVSELFARIHGAPMSFQGESSGFDHPAIKGNLVFGRLELSDFSILTALQRAQKTLPLSLEPAFESKEPAAEESAEDSATPSTVSDSNDFEQTTDSQQGLLPQVQEQQSAQVTDPAKGQTENVSELKTNQFDLLNHFDFDGSIVIGELKAGPVTLAQIKSPMSVQNGILRLSKASAITYDGKTKLEAQLNSNGHWNVLYRADSINLSALMEDAGGNNKTGGVMGLQANLYGDGFSKETLYGQIGFSAARAKLFGLDLDSSLKDLKAFRDPAQSNDLFTQTEHIEGLVTIHDAQADIEKLSFNFGFATAEGSAVVDLEDQALSGSIRGVHHSGLQLFANLSGQWFNPIVILDTQKIKEVNKLLPPVKPADKAQPSGWDKLKNFFKERF